MAAGKSTFARASSITSVLNITPELTIQSLRLIPRVGWAASRLLAFAPFRLLRPQLILRQDKYARHFAYRTDDPELRKAAAIPSTITAQLHGLALHDGVGIIKMHLFVCAEKRPETLYWTFSRLPMFGAKPNERGLWRAR
jgi:hypothetical protein